MTHGNTKTSWKIISHIRKNGAMVEHTAMNMVAITGTEARRAFKLYRDLITFSVNYSSYSHSVLMEWENRTDWKPAVTVTHNYFNKS
jgi:hypothetical protein